MLKSVLSQRDNYKKDCFAFNRMQKWILSRKFNSQEYCKIKVKSSFEQIKKILPNIVQNRHRIVRNPHDSESISNKLCLQPNNRTRFPHAAVIQTQSALHNSAIVTK